MLPKILERAGTNDKGSITGLYSVLVEGDDFNEPISDAVRSILDGHVTLSRKLASHNQYPAVDVLDSVSRLMLDISTPEHIELAGQVREILATYRESEDLINIGAYVKGSSKKIDFAISKIDQINRFFRQGIREERDFDKSLAALAEIISESAPPGESNEEVQIPAGAAA